MRAAFTPVTDNASVDEIEWVLREAEQTCERIQVFVRGVRLANRAQDTELARVLLDLIQSEFE